MIIMLTAVILSAGCLKMDHTLYLREDGTMTYKLKYSISEQAISQFIAAEKLKDKLAEARGEPPPASNLDPLLQIFLNPDEASLRKELEKYEKDGLVIKKLDVKASSARRYIELNVDISDPAKLSQSDFFRRNGFNLTKDRSGNYIFYREPHINRPGEIIKQPTEQELRQMIPILAGFKTTVHINTPGTVISTTAFNNSVGAVSWTFDFDRDPGAIQALQHQAFRVVFKAPAATLPELHYDGSQITK
jgi:hypothetical protein